MGKDEIGHHLSSVVGAASAGLGRVGLGRADLGDIVRPAYILKPGHLPATARGGKHIQIAVSIDIGDGDELVLGIANDGEGNGILFHEGLHLGGFLIHTDRQDHEALVLVFFLEFVHDRKGFRARPAPRGPEIQNHHLALEGVGQFAFQFKAAEVGQGVADFQRGVGREQGSGAQRRQREFFKQGCIH